VKNNHKCNRSAYEIEIEVYMAYKILENDNVEIENVDGAAFNNFAAGNKDGVLVGVLNECALFAVGNVISVNTGCLLVCGIRVKITEAESVTIASVPSVNTRYQLIAQVVMNEAKEISFSLFARTIEPLIQHPLYITGEGTYQVELGQFIHTTEGDITQVVKTIPTLTAGQKGDKGDPSTLDKIGTAITTIDLTDIESGVYGTIQNPVVIEENSTIQFVNYAQQLNYQKSFILYIKRADDVSVTWQDVTAWEYDEIPLLPIGKVQKVLVETVDGVSFFGSCGGYFSVEEE
jgi:hypothetical protein